MSGSKSMNINKIVNKSHSPLRERRDGKISKPIHALIELVGEML